MYHPLGSPAGSALRLIPGLILRLIANLFWPHHYTVYNYVITTMTNFLPHLMYIRQGMVESSEVGLEALQRRVDIYMIIISRGNHQCHSSRHTCILPLIAPHLPFCYDIVSVK